MFRILMISLAALSLAACQAKKSVTADAPDQAQGPVAGDQSKEAKAFLAKNAKEPGVVTLPDGLQYRIVHSGPATGLKPHIQDEVKVNYEGSLLSGDVFDSSFKHGEPATFTLDGVITGWTEVMQLMRPGDEWIVWIPPQLGYGEEDKGAIDHDPRRQVRRSLPCSFRVFRG